MCPDKVTLSSFFDKELSRELSIGIQKHIDKCEKCSKLISSFQHINHMCHTKDIDIKVSEDRVWEKIKNKQIEKPKTIHIWQKKVMIPVPLAYAAMVLGFFLIAAVLFNNAKIQPDLQMIPVAATNQQMLNEANNIQDVLHFLEKNNIPVEVNINLGETANVSVDWEPEMIKASDYKRRYK